MPNLPPAACVLWGFSYDLIVLKLPSNPKYPPIMPNLPPAACVLWGFSYDLTKP